MGRKTFESIGKALPKRLNIVVTNQDSKFDGCETVHSVEEALTLCEGEKLVSIIGGAKIFKQSIDFTNLIHLTRIHHSFEADTFFPEIDLDKWHLTKTENHQADEKNPYPYSFLSFESR